MRILHIITCLDAGGAERMLSRLVTHRPNPDVEQIVVSLMNEGRYGNEIKNAGVELHTMGLERGAISPVIVFRLASLIRRKAPDVVMSWLYHADLAATLSTLFSGRSARRVIWNLRNSELNFDHFSKTTKITLSTLARLSFLPGAIVSNSKSGIEFHKSQGYRPRVWAYLPNGLNVDVWQPSASLRSDIRNRLNVDEKDILVGMIARNDAQKDYQTFLDACGRLAEDFQHVRFVLIGKDTQVLDTTKIPATRINALGMRNDVPHLIHALDINVLSSAFGEGCPNSVIEAMAVGIPSVVTDVGDCAHLVEGSGIAVPARAPQQLADAIATLVDETTEQRQKRGQSARAKILDMYTLDRVIEQYKAVWLTVFDSLKNT